MTKSLRVFMVSAGVAMALGALLPGLTQATDADCELARKGTVTIIITPEGSGISCYGNPDNCCRSN
jgi:hypothetical protein